MALPKVTPGTYNYGAYSNPTPIKYKGGLGEGLAGIAVAGAQVIKAKKEQKEKEDKEKEQNQFTAFDSSHVYKQGLMKSLPNANEENTRIINELTQKRYETVLAYKNREISFDEYRMRYDKEENIKNKLINFKDYVLDKAEGEEADFASIRQTEGDINKWGRDKAFSYGAQGFKLDINYKNGTVGFIHPALDWDKFKDEEGIIDFSKIGDIENTDNWRTVSTDIDELFADKNAFAPTLKYNYSQDAQFFNDSIANLTPEAGRFATGNDNGFAVFKNDDKERFKNEAVLPTITDQMVQLRGVQIYEDILGLGTFDKNNEEHAAIVKNELADQILNYMPKSFGRIPKDTSRQSAFAEQTADREQRLNAARESMESISLESGNPKMPKRSLGSVLEEFNNKILNRGYRIIVGDGTGGTESGNYYVERIEGVTATGIKQGKDTTDITTIIDQLQKTQKTQRLVDRLMSLVYQEDPYSQYEVK